MPDWLSEKLVIQKYQYAETKRKKRERKFYSFDTKDQEKRKPDKTENFQAMATLLQIKNCRKHPTPSSKVKVEIYIFFLEGFIGISHPLIPS